MDNWIEILEFNKNSEETWNDFLKLLDDEKIQHKEEIKERWEGSARIPRYEQYVIVYIPKEYKEKVEGYLKEYSNSDNIVDEELKNISSEEEEEKREYKKRNIAQKILILTPFVMVGIAIIFGIISGFMYN